MWAVAACKRLHVTTHLLASRLELAVEELQAVVEDILIGGVQAGLDAVPNHIGSSWRTLQLQDLGSRQTRGAMSDILTYIHELESSHLKYYRKIFPFAGSADVFAYRYGWKTISLVRAKDENRGGGGGLIIQQPYLHGEALALTRKTRRNLFLLWGFVCIKELGRISSLNRRTKSISSVFHSEIYVPNERTRSVVVDKRMFRFIKRSNLT